MATAATPVFADAVQVVAQAEPVPHREPMWIGLVRLALLPLAWRTSGTFAEQIHRARRRRVKLREREAERVSVLTQREDRKRARLEEREALAAQARQARLKEKEQTVAARRQARDAWQATKRRQRQRQQLNSRLADYYKRLTRPFTAHR